MNVSGNCLNRADRKERLEDLSCGMGKYVDCAAAAGGMSATAVLQGDTAHTTDEAKIKAASANQGGKRSANYDNSNPVTVASLPTV